MDHVYFVGLVTTICNLAVRKVVVGCGRQQLDLTCSSVALLENFFAFQLLEMQRDHRMNLLCVCFAMILCVVWPTIAYSPHPTNMSYPSQDRPCNRREHLVKISAAATMVVASSIAALPVQAKSAPPAASNPLPELILAQETLGKLLENWKRATIDCTFADVPRDLLEQKNKALLLEKASTFALFDKSVSVETCKTTNRVVRDYLGVTGIGPLVGIEKKLKRGFDFLEDVSDLDQYVVEFESFSQSLSRAISLSYTAGVADFDSVNNFSKEEADDGTSDSPNSNLNQAKDAITEAKASLDKIVALLQKGSE
jgi:hypothetical protein